MELRLIKRKSSKIDELVRRNFGQHEDLWNPRYFDLLFQLSYKGCSDPLAVCTLQWADDYWILGDLCVSTQKCGYGTEIVNQIMNIINKPVWVDANELSSKIFEQNPMFTKTTKGPWKPDGRAFISKQNVTTCQDGDVVL